MKPYHKLRKRKKQTKDTWTGIDNYIIKEQAEKLSKKQSTYTKRHNIYFNGTEEEKAETFVHFSNTGYGCMAMIIMAVALIIGIVIRGFIGYFLCLIGIGWVLYHFPNLMQMWTNIEHYNPDTKKYRLDNFK